MPSFGPWSLDLIVENTFPVDGGAMYGVVPRKLWSRGDPPDENNLVLLNTNVYVLRREREVVLIDAGLGSALDEKIRKVYAIAGESQLLLGLAALGVRPEDVTQVIFTHLHWDHTAGAFRLDEDGQYRLQFPSAVHWAQEREWRELSRTNERTSAAYPSRMLPLLELGKLVRVEGEREVLPGLWVRLTGGHTEGHQCIELLSEGTRIVFPGDLIPSRFHLKLPYVAAVDTFPLTTMERKRSLLAQTEGPLILALDHERRDPILQWLGPACDPPYRTLE